MKEKIVLRVGSQVDDLSMSALFGGVGDNCNVYTCFRYCKGKCGCFCTANKSSKCPNQYVAGFVGTVTLNF